MASARSDHKTRLRNSADAMSFLAKKPMIVLRRCGIGAVERVARQCRVNAFHQVPQPCDMALDRDFSV